MLRGLPYTARRHLPPLLALAEAGVSAAEVLQARVPILPGFSAETSALARELARRALPARTRHTTDALETPEASLLDLPPTSPPEAAAVLSDPGDASQCKDTLAPGSDSSLPPAPPSPGLRRETIAHISSPSVLVRPVGRARDWIDASGPPSLLTLRLLNRRIWSARNGGPPAPLISLGDAASWLLHDSAGWPTALWSGDAGRALNGRVARELRFAEVLGGFETPPTPPSAIPPTPVGCSSTTACAGTDLFRGYFLDELGHWWCDVCWGQAQMLVDAPAASSAGGAPPVALQFTLA